MKITIIGGGVIGAACAYYLQRRGHAITLLDRGEFGAACSRGNCGYVCPSHVLPLTTPAALRLAFSSLFKKSAPFRVKPRLDWRLLAWFYRFARRCNTRDMLAAGAEIQTLLNSSRKLYDELFAAEPFDAEWETNGLLFVFQSEKAFHHYEATNTLLSESFAQPAKPFAGAELTALEPALKPGSAGGWLYGGDGHLRPEKLMESWRRILVERGATVVESCSVSGFTEGGKAAITSKGEMAADAFVVATGAMTPFLNAALGCSIPIQPGKGYSLTMPLPSICPKIPMIFEEHSVAVTPMASGYRIGSTMEFAGYDSSMNRARLDYLKDSAGIYLREPTAEPVLEEWYGWRPMTWDSKPIIGRSPRYPNVWIAAGHNMLGISMAPATGKLIGELIDGQPTHIDAEPFRVGRRR